MCEGKEASACYRPGSLIEVWTGWKRKNRIKNGTGSIKLHMSRSDVKEQHLRGAVCIVKKWGLEQLLFIEYNYLYLGGTNMLVNRQLGNHLDCVDMGSIILLTDQAAPNVFFNVVEPGGGEKESEL